MVLSPVVDLQHVMTAMRKSVGVMVRIFLHASSTSCVEIPTQSVHAVTLRGIDQTGGAHVGVS